MNPKHHNPTQKRRDGRGNEFWAHAPYNFVPLPEKVVTVDPDEIPGHDVYTEYTGYIDCTLETRSPLYTRCALDPEFFARWADNIREMMKNDAAREKYAQFFHLDDAERPVIPGSSLRGMVRALVEIAGYGKMQWVTNEPLVFRAVGDTTSLGNYYRQRLVREDKPRHYTPLVRAGYMEKQGSHWFIRPAQTIGGTTFARIYHDLIPKGTLAKWHDCKNARRLWVRLGTYDYQPVRGGFLHLKYTPVLEARSEAAPGFQEAVLAYSGRMNSKKREVVVFPPDQSANLIPIDDELVRVYRDQITQGQQQLLGPEGVLNPGQPVFYLMENGRLVFFGHTMLFRLPYPQNPFDLIPSNLHQSNDIDLAEAIFGWVPEGERKDSRAGRVFFTDAICDPDQKNILLSEQPITPQILASPKPTTFQHYLVQDKDKDHDPDNKQKLAHYGTPTPDETVIRGHKLYWHRGAVGPDDVREQSQVDWSTDTQHTQIKPVRAGVTFRFRIYFENLRDFELGALLWALTLPGEPGKDYCHSLGMGKPLGMGAVKITPTLYLSNRKDRYTRLFAGDDWQRGEREEPDIRSFICAFEGFVLNGMDAQERRQAQSLKEVDRIKMLLKMLEWPGPDRPLTEYMTIEPVNEYKERPVLPDPFHIEDLAGGAQPSQRPSGRHSGGRKSGKRRGRR